MFVVQLILGSHDGCFGFSIVGAKPVQVSAVRCGGPAYSGGLRPGDQLRSVNGLCVRTYTHLAVSRIIR